MYRTWHVRLALFKWHVLTAVIVMTGNAAEVIMFAVLSALYSGLRPSTPTE